MGNEIFWDQRWGDLFLMLMNSSCILQDAAVCCEMFIPGTEPYLLIGCSLLLSMSGLGGGAEKVLKLRDRGRGEGLEACLLRSPSSIWAPGRKWWRKGYLGLRWSSEANSFFHGCVRHQRWMSEALTQLRSSCRPLLWGNEWNKEHERTTRYKFTGNRPLLVSSVTDRSYNTMEECFAIGAQPTLRIYYNLTHTQVCKAILVRTLDWLLFIVDSLTKTLTLTLTLTDSGLTLNLT